MMQSWAMNYIHYRPLEILTLKIVVVKCCLCNLSFLPSVAYVIYLGKYYQVFMPFVGAIYVDESIKPKTHIMCEEQLSKTEFFM